MLYDQLVKHIENASKVDDFDKLYNILTRQLKKTNNNIATYKKQWDVDLHDVCNKNIRLDRKSEVDDPKGEEDTKTIDSPVNRVPVPFQKDIVRKSVSFLFGNPVTLTIDSDDKSAEESLNTIIQIGKDNKIDTLNQKLAHEIFRATEAAEIWYVVPSDEKHDRYGFSTTSKIRVAWYSPWGDDERPASKLYPLFDDYGDMIAFSREWEDEDDEGNNETRFELYTKDVIIRWRKTVQQKWTIYHRSSQILKKIPVIYGRQPLPEWYDVQRAIDRLETLLSNHGDINDYNGAPILVAHGNIISMGAKGDRGRVMEIEHGGDMKYISWDHAPESIKLEIDTLFRVIYSFTQTPEISFENVKGITAISGIAIKLLFMDAHLKVLEKRQIFDAYLDRRSSLLKTIASKLNPSGKYEDLRITSTITPFLIEDDKELIASLYTATGGKPIISQKSAANAATRTGLVKDAKFEYEQLQAEAAAEREISLTEPTF